MSEVTAAPIVDPDIKPAAVVDNVNDHTPEPVTPPIVERVPAPEHPEADSVDVLATLTEKLGDAVALLATVATKLAETVTARDESPASVPWTHRGSTRHDED